MNLIDAILTQANVLQAKYAVKQKLTYLIQKQDVVLVALCGESAAGKTTLLRALKAQIPELSVINADNYFCDISDKVKKFGSFTKLVESGYQTESAENFQMELLRQDLKKLKEGKVIQTPCYDMKKGASRAKAIICKPAKIVFVESICTLYPQVRDLFDFKIYLSVDKNVQWARYQERAAERGQNPQEIAKQFEIISQAAEKYIKPYKAYVDLVIERKIPNRN